ncbi:MAG: arsenic resistance N-acetyltransferase ArsN2 [Ignavibacteria bacterium]|nr:arsenic resistance N-acetyltransferase ArsN2 [Ignavibacteria bacterium]
MVTVRPALDHDLDVVCHLLTRNELPVLGVKEHLRDFFVAEEDGSVIGAIGLERYEETGLLRSAVVDRSKQGKRIGSKLVDTLLRSARATGVKKLVLLTNTAEQYFARKGFRTIDRSTLDGPVTRSVEFTDACPSHAVCMEKIL